MQDLSKEWLDFLRNQFPAGSRIQTWELDDHRNTLEEAGTLDRIDDEGRFHVRQSDGGERILALGEEMFSVHPPEPTLLKLYMPMSVGYYTRGEAAGLLDALLTCEPHIREPPIIAEFPIQTPDEVNLHDYLLELRRIPEPIRWAFADSGWTYAVDFRHLAGLTRRYGTSCTGAADYDKKHIYVSEAKATVHEFGHFLDSMLGFPSGRSSFYEAEADAASAFLRAYAGTSCREYFADYFAYYIANHSNAEKAAQMERLTPETFAFFSALEAGGWQLQSRPHNR